MRQTNVSSLTPNNSKGAASRANGTTSFDKLTKAQLIELLSGNITQPLTPDGFYRCAVSVLGKWCDDVIKGNYASMYNLQTQLDALQNIYRRN